MALHILLNALGVAAAALVLLELPIFLPNRKPFNRVMAGCNTSGTFRSRAWVV